MYIGLLIYFVLLYIRPGDWIQAVLNWPFEVVVVGLTTISSFMLASRSKRAGSWPSQIPWLAIWVLVIFLSNAVHGNFSAGLEYAIVFGKRAIIFLMVWMVLDSISKLRGVIFFQVLLTALLGLQGLYQIQHGYGWAGQPLYWGNRIRWVGLWDGANVLSLVFVSAMPFVLEMIFGRKSMISRLFAIVAGTFIIIGLYLANSRGGWIALAVVFLVYFKSQIGKRGVVLGGLLVLALFAWGPSRLSEIDSKEKSAAHRIDMWSDGIDMLKENPILGVGKGEFQTYTHTLIAHNTFIQNMSETGLVGLFVWVALIYLSFKSLAVVLRNKGEIDFRLVSMARAVLVSFIGYLSASFFITADFETLYILMAFCSAVLTIARKESEKELPLHVSIKDWRNIAFLEVGGILSMYFAINILK